MIFSWLIIVNIFDEIIIIFDAIIKAQNDYDNYKRVTTIFDAIIKGL